MSATGGKVGKGAGLGIATAGIAIFAILFLLLTLAFVLVALGLPIWAGMLIVGVLLIIAGTITGLLAQEVPRGGQAAEPRDRGVREDQGRALRQARRPRVRPHRGRPIAAVAEAVPETPGT